MEAERDFLTVAETAKELGLTVRAVQDRLLHGHMRGVRLTPKMWIVSRDEVERQRVLGRLKPGRRLGSIRITRAEGASEVRRF